MDYNHVQAPLKSANDHLDDPDTAGIFGQWVGAGLGGCTDHLPPRHPHPPDIAPADVAALDIGITGISEGGIIQPTNGNTEGRTRLCMGVVSVSPVDTPPAFQSISTTGRTIGHDQ
ncbi:hypothetical protein CRENBAI_020872 [Crenichthys baileyi]|uniref:Uncharacterized protein n=1 Tax=Crenichthys baileyi TaxID=28760 RepID=A0AAV9S3H1_9TELE